VVDGSNRKISSRSSIQHLGNFSVERLGGDYVGVAGNLLWRGDSSLQRRGLVERYGNLGEKSHHSVGQFFLRRVGCR
jgi:hypothetical protein